MFGKTMIIELNDTVISSSAYDNPYLFTGRRYDSDTALYYYRARYYSPELGRFISADPIGYLGGLNLYAYVGNNPLNWIDPWGLCKEEIDDEEMVSIFDVGYQDIMSSAWGIEYLFTKGLDLSVEALSELQHIEEIVIPPSHYTGYNEIRIPTQFIGTFAEYIDMNCSEWLEDRAGFAKSRMNYYLERKKVLNKRLEELAERYSRWPKLRRE